MNYKHVTFVYSEPETDEEKEYEEDRRLVDHEYRGIVVQVACARIDCDVEEAFTADEQDIASDNSRLHFIIVPLPEGWGYDRHGGPDPALHCPNHRNPPTAEELAAFEQRSKEDDEQDN